MNRPRTALSASRATVAVAAALLGCDAHAAASAQDAHRLAGDRVAVYNLAGTIEIVRGDGPDVVVEVARGGADADRLVVETGAVDGIETLRVIYPEDRVLFGEGRSRATVRVRRDGTFGGGWRGGREVTVSGRGGGLEAHADLTVRVPRGAEVRAHLAVGNAWARDLDADVSINTMAGRVEVEGVTGNVDADTGSGAITVADVAGDVNADTGSGSVELSGVRGARVGVDTGSGSITLRDVDGVELSADTGSGRIEGSGLALSELQVDTGSGTISLSGVEAEEISCDTGSGSVRLGLVSDVDRLVVETGSGSVEVEVPAEFGAALQLESGTGGVSVDVPDVRAAEAKRRSFRGRVGDGDGRVMISTGSGGIRIRSR